MSKNRTQYPTIKSDHLTKASIYFFLKITAEAFVIKQDSLSLLIYTAQTLLCISPKYPAGYAVPFPSFWITKQKQMTSFKTWSLYHLFPIFHKFIFSNAALAAFCSASFLLFPLPCPNTFPSCVTSATKTLL